MVLNVPFQVTQEVAYFTIEVYLCCIEKPLSKSDFFRYKPNTISRYHTIFLLNPLSVVILISVIYYIYNGYNKNICTEFTICVLSSLSF